MKSMNAIFGCLSLILSVGSAFAAPSPSIEESGARSPSIKEAGTCGNGRELFSKIKARLDEEMKPLLAANREFLSALSQEQIDELKALGHEWERIEKDNSVSQQGIKSFLESSDKLDELARFHGLRVNEYHKILLTDKNLYKLERWHQKGIAYASFGERSTSMGIARQDYRRAGDAFTQEIGISYSDLGGLGKPIVQVQATNPREQFDEPIILPITEYVQMHLPESCLPKSLTEEKESPFAERDRRNKLKVAAFLRERGILTRGTDPNDTVPELKRRKAECLAEQRAHEAELTAYGKAMEPYILQVLNQISREDQAKFEFFTRRRNFVHKTLEDEKAAEYEDRVYLADHFRREIREESYLRQDQHKKLYAQLFLDPARLTKLEPNETFQKLAHTFAADGVELKFYIPSSSNRLSSDHIYLTQKRGMTTVIAGYLPGADDWQYYFMRDPDKGMPRNAAGAAYQRLPKECHEVMLSPGGGWWEETRVSLPTAARE